MTMSIRRRTACYVGQARMILSFSYDTILREGVGHWQSMGRSFEKQDQGDRIQEDRMKAEG